RHTAASSASVSLNASGTARCSRSSSATDLIRSSSGATAGMLSRTSTFFIGLESGGQMPLLKRKHMRLRALALANPHHGASLLVGFEHVFRRGLLVEAEQLAQHHYRVGHAGHRVVQKDDAPDGLP